MSEKKRKYADLDKSESSDTIHISEEQKEKLYDILFDIQNNNQFYLDIENIINNLEKSINSNTNGFINRCTECNIDMGPHNPRQLCGKYYCHEKI